MTHRSFQDRDGRRWDVWDVHPVAPERRAMERRQLVESGRLVERRTGAERRRQRTPRAVIDATYTGGWLCFEDGAERRRHAPIPSDWTSWDDTRLEACCRSAIRVARRVVS
jgi:hypothetical protein